VSTTGPIAGTIAEHHRAALAATRRILAGVGMDQWHLPTPCEDWDVRRLVEHVVAGNLWAAELSSGRSIADVGDRLDGDVLGDDPLAAYDASATAAADVFERPGALDAPCAVSYGPVPGSVYAGHRFVDVLIHGWDLAVATGQDATLDPALVEACWAEVEPQLELLHASGMFGTASEAATADRQSTLLGAMGRSPRRD
jgi:uncharacterized protein (TIGR03086 family)